MLALPKLYSANFFRTRTFQKIAVLAYPPPTARDTLGGDSYMRGGCHMITFPDLTVNNSKPIHGTKVPLYPATLKREVEKNPGVGACLFIKIDATVGESVTVEVGFF